MGGGEPGFSGPSVLIVDEVGYLPMPAEDANALFQVISQRYLRGSVILTHQIGMRSCLTGLGRFRLDGGAYCPVGSIDLDPRRRTERSKRDGPNTAGNNRPAASSTAS